MIATKSKTVGLGGLGSASAKIKQLQNDDKSAQDISLDLVDFDENQYRKDKSGYDLKKLADSIKAKGLIHFPVYEKQQNGRYLVNVGEMRTRAYMLLRDMFPDDPKWQSIPARIKVIPMIEGLSAKASRLVYQFAENELQEKPTLFDRAEGLAAIFEEGGKEAVKLVLSNEGLKDSDAEVSKWKSVAKANTVIRKDVIEGGINDKETVITLSKIADEDPKRYENIIEKFKAKELDSSIAQTAKTEWTKLKEKSGKKTSAKQTGSRSKPADNKPKNSHMEFSAKGMKFEDGVLTIETSNGFVMKFTSPNHLEVVISETEK